MFLASGVLPNAKEQYFILHHLSKISCILAILKRTFVLIDVQILLTNMYFCTFLSRTYDVFRQLEAFQVFHVLVFSVNNFCEFLSFHKLLINVHLYFWLEQIRMIFHIGADNTRNHRAPARKAKQFKYPRHACTNRQHAFCSRTPR